MKKMIQTKENLTKRRENQYVVITMIAFRYLTVRKLIC